MRRIDRRNIVCNTAGEGLWGFGWSIAAPLTVFPILIQRLGGGAFEVGILAAIVSAGAILPQIFGSLVFRTGQGRKRFLINIHLYVVAPPWMLMGLVMLFISGSNPKLARAFLLLLIALSYVSIGFVLSLWFDWVAGLFRREFRGFAIGLAHSASAVGGAVAAMVAALVIGNLRYPSNYAFIFFCAAGFFVMSMVAFMFVQVERIGRPNTLTAKDVLARFKHSLAIPNLRRYLVARSFMAIGAASTSFFTVHYLSERGGGVAGKTVVALGALIMAGEALFSVLIGRLGDRIGHRAGILVGSAAQVVSIALAILVPGPVSCGIAFVLSGIGFAGAAVSHQNFLFETCPHDSRTAHITISNLVLAPTMMFTPLAIGRATEVFSTAPVFGFCLASTLISIVLLLRFVRNPDVSSPADSIDVSG